jgi:lactate 2-monooxygenase
VSALGDANEYLRHPSDQRVGSIVPNRLVPTTKPDLRTTLLGFDIPYPLAIAPVGVLKIFHPDAECGVASAAASLGVPYTLSTASATSIETVAEASGDALRFYQLYWPANEHNDITASLLRRAKESGFKALIVTLDTYILGWRPDDADHAYNPFLKADEIGVEIGFSDPVFRGTCFLLYVPSVSKSEMLTLSIWVVAKFKKITGKEIEEDMQHAAQTWAGWIFPGFSHSWEDLAFLREHWDGPIVLKGIQTIKDAKKAASLGIEGIVVSYVFLSLSEALKES